MKVLIGLVCLFFLGWLIVPIIALGAAGYVITILQFLGITSAIGFLLAKLPRKDD